MRKLTGCLVLALGLSAPLAGPALGAKHKPKHKPKLVCTKKKEQKGCALPKGAKYTFKAKAPSAMSFTAVVLGVPGHRGARVLEGFGAITRCGNAAAVTTKRPIVGKRYKATRARSHGRETITSTISFNIVGAKKMTVKVHTVITVLHGSHGRPHGHGGPPSHAGPPVCDQTASATLKRTK